MLARPIWLAPALPFLVLVQAPPWVEEAQGRILVAALAVAACFPGPVQRELHRTARMGRRT